MFLVNFHAFIICFSKVAWNTHIIIFGRCESFLMGISSVYYLLLNGHMELPIIIRLCVKDFLMVVSFLFNVVFLDLPVKGPFGDPQLLCR